MFVERRNDLEKEIHLLIQLIFSILGFGFHYQLKSPSSKSAKVICTLVVSEHAEKICEKNQFNKFSSSGTSIIELILQNPSHVHYVCWY